MPLEGVSPLCTVGRDQFPQSIRLPFPHIISDTLVTRLFHSTFLICLTLVIISFLVFYPIQSTSTTWSLQQPLQFTLSVDFSVGFYQFILQQFQEICEAIDTQQVFVKHPNTYMKPMMVNEKSDKSEKNDGDDGQHESRRQKSRLKVGTQKVHTHQYNTT